MNAENLIKAQEQAPGAFVENAFYERLLNMRATDKKTFESISPASKLALLQYEANKRKAESLKEEKI